MCGEEQPGMENFEFFLAGTSLVLPKYTILCQNVQIPHQNVPIPCHGEKNGSVIPSWELDCQEKKYFST